jgi:type II secretory ATPase GspE/PulE/Tfp pilus assembly ATPase PilB-like protein
MVVRVVPLLFVLCFAAPSVALGASGGWPPPDFDPDFFRGPGFYLSVGKIVTVWLIFLVWVKTADWINQDVQLFRFQHNLWNAIVVGSFSVAFLLIWVLPNFILGLALLIVAYLAPFILYVFAYRNPKVADHETVLTGSHLRFWFSEKLKYIGIKIDAERQVDPALKGPPLQLVAKGAASDHEDQAHLMLARQMPGFLPVRKLLDNAIQHRAGAVLLDLAEQVSVRYLIDGVWHNHEPQARELGDQIVGVLKTVSALGAEVKGEKLEGKFGMVAGADGKNKIHCELTCQVQGGTERVLIKFVIPEAFHSLEELGMRSKMVEELSAMMREDKGLIIFAGLPGGGVTTTIDVLLNAVDRLLRDFVSVEDVHKPETPIQNIDVKTYDRAAGQTPATILPAIGRAKPDAIVCRDLFDGDSATILCEQAKERLVLVSVASKDAAEALLRVLVLKTSPSKLASAAIGVLHQRLARRLCPSCREAYEPSPEFLMKLGIPPKKVTQLYRAPKEGRGTCKDCLGVGFRGRTGMFELLKVDDQIRKVLTTKPDLELLRKAARAAKMATERDHGIVLVARGETSLEEIQRVLQA